jgi:hypothetical protein
MPATNPLIDTSLNGRDAPGLFTWDLRVRQLTNSYYYDRSVQFMAWDASAAWVVFSTCVAGARIDALTLKTYTRLVKSL